MVTFSRDQSALVGEGGSLSVPTQDVITYKLAMLLEGECGGLGPTAAARKYDYTKQRYLQLRARFLAQGALGLQDLPRGPKTDYRRTDELVRRVIRYRVLDPETSVAVIAQKLQQAHYPISIRSVERVIADYGLQKKLFAVNPKTPLRTIKTQRTRRKRRLEPADPQSLERQVRQLLADKISGNQVGLWLLLPEHLRLGTCVVQWQLLGRSDLRLHRLAAPAAQPRPQKP